MATDGLRNPGAPARGTRSGRPIMVLFDALGKRWSLRILWELRSGRLAFRPLRARCDDISPTVLNDRLKQLKALGILDSAPEGYGLTQAGAELAKKLIELDGWANAWARNLTGEPHVKKGELKGE